MRRRVVARLPVLIAGFAAVAVFAATTSAQPASVDFVWSSDGTLYVLQAGNAMAVVPDHIVQADLEGLNLLGEIDGTVPTDLFAQPPPPGARVSPVRVGQGDDGTLYLVQGGTAWKLVPAQIADADLAAMNPGADIHSVLPDALLFGQTPSSTAEQPAPPPPVAAAPPPPAGPVLPCLSPISADTAKTLKSQNSRTSTHVKFVNDTPDTVDVLWIDYVGQTVQYRRLAAGESYVQQTYVTHPWIIFNVRTQSYVVGFLPAAQDTTASLSGKPCQ